MKRNLFQPMRTLFLFFILGLFLPLGESSGLPPGPPLDRERREKVHKKIETMRMWRLTEILDLNEEKSSKLFPLLRKYDEKRRAAGEERAKLMRSMREFLEEDSPSNAKLKEALDRLEANDASMDDLERERMRELKGLLTPLEVAKFIFFQEEFEREMRDTIERVRERERSPEPQRRRLRRP